MKGKLEKVNWQEILKATATCCGGGGEDIKFLDPSTYQHDAFFDLICKSCMLKITSGEKTRYNPDIKDFPFLQKSLC
jgi:hypothetical protein